MNSNNMKPQTPKPQLQQLILSLEQATLMAKQLKTTTDHNHLLQIHSSLHQAHHYLSSFIATAAFPSPPQTTSLSSAPADVDDPMMVGDEEDENNSIDGVEERMRECFIQNKRPKRPLSPSLVGEERRVGDVGEMGFDPRGNRLRALDLIYQFHG